MLREVLGESERLILALKDCGIGVGVYEGAVSIWRTVGLMILPVGAPGSNLCDWIRRGRREAPDGVGVVPWIGSGAAVGGIVPAPWCLTVDGRPVAMLAFVSDLWDEARHRREVRKKKRRGEAN